MIKHLPTFTKTLRGYRSSLECIFFDNQLNQISIDKNNYNAFLNLGNLYKEINKLDESIENLNEAIKINNNFYNAYHNRAVVKRLLFRFDDAIEDFDEALERRGVIGASEEILKIKGKHSNKINDILGYVSKSEVIHKDDMVLIK